MLMPHVQSTGEHLIKVVNMPFKCVNVEVYLLQNEI
jgi:uncharacterized Zn-finger protein